ncbi:MAG: guanylate kinase [Solirubrobacteraceae bacterium]|jgi:guanylate kinase
MSSVYVITGPSGVGKGTLIAALRERRPELELSVSATTRAPRPGEADGVAYYFLSEAEFDRRLAAGEFVEHAAYAGHRYGTLRGELARHTWHGASVLLEIEVQGARQVRAAIADAVLVFIAPPSLEVLRERLIARGTDDAQTIDERLEAAAVELTARAEFPHVIVNDRLAAAIDELEALYVAHARASGASR